MSYETEIKKKIEENDSLPEKLNISFVKYFWQITPLGSSKEKNIPKFLRKIDVFKNFTDHELFVLSKFIHVRVFSDKEVVFKQHDVGVGFYLIHSGKVDVKIDGDDIDKPGANDYQLSLERYEYFGELALLQEHSIRSASVISKGRCELLGIFKPDLDQLIYAQPIVAAKLLQSVSIIISNRLFSLSNEVQRLKYRFDNLDDINE